MKHLLYAARYYTRLFANFCEFLRIFEKFREKYGLWKKMTDMDFLQDMVALIPKRNFQRSAHLPISI